MFRSHCFLPLCPVVIALAQTAAPPQPTVTMSVEPAKPMPSVPPDRVVLTVGDIQITAEQFEQILQMLPMQYQVSARGAGRKQFADGLARVFALAQEGKRRKLDEAPAFKTQTMYQNANLLAARTIDRIKEETVAPEAEVRKYYDEHRSAYEQVRGRHILIRTQGSTVPVRPGQKDLTEQEALAKAQELRKKLAAGQDFAALAREESDDTKSGANGGDLGPFRRNQMVPAFDEVAFKLEPGEVSEPVKTLFGFHLIRIDARENWTYEEAKSEVERRLKPEFAMKAAKDLEQKSKPVYDPEFFSLPKQ